MATERKPREPLTEPVYDKFGHLITVGCYIAYPYEWAGWSLIRIGRVLELWGAKINPGYITPRLTVRGALDLWQGEVKPLNRDVILEYPERTIVLPDPLIPDTYKRIIG